MGYFKGLSLFWAIYCMAAVLLHVLLAKKFPNLIAEKLLPEKKPIWVTVILFIFVFLTFYTWYQFSLFTHALSFVMSLFITVGLVKMFFLVKHYTQMRKVFLVLITGDPLPLNLLLMSSLLIGVGFFWICFSL